MKVHRFGHWPFNVFSFIFAEILEAKLEIIKREYLMRFSVLAVLSNFPQSQEKIFLITMYEYEIGLTAYYSCTFLIFIFNKSKQESF